MHEFPKFYFVKKLYMFQAFPLPIIRSFLLYFRHWYITCRFDDIFAHLVGFIKKKFVTMHGHMNVKSLELPRKYILDFKLSPCSEYSLFSYG